MTSLLLLAAVACLSGRTTKELPLYAPGEEMTFEAKLQGFGERDSAKMSIAWKRTGDDGRTESGKAPADRPFVYRTSLDLPGFVRLEGRLLDEQGQPVSVERDGRKSPVIMDLGAGVDIEKIRPAVPAPADFAAFWARHKANLASVAWKDDVRLREIASPTDGMRLFEFSVPCYGGKPATGHLAVPADGTKKYPATVKFFGYNESWTYKRAILPPGKLAADRIGQYVSAHGFEMGRDEAYYRAEREKAKSNGFGHGFDPAQNADPETTYYAGMTYRLMRALEFLKSLPEWNGKDLAVTGGSQGGLQSVWAAALVPGVSEARIAIPWNCDIGGTELGRNRGTWYVKWAPGLGYYDLCGMAPLIPKSCRLVVTMAGLGDYICPPTGVMAFYNGVTAPKEMTFVQNAQHGNWLEPAPQKFRLVGDKVTPVGHPPARTENAALDLAGAWQVTAEGISARMTLPGTLAEHRLGKRWTEEDFRTTMDFPQSKALVQEHQFVGPATYERTFEVAEDGSRCDWELYLDRVMWTSEAWLDGERIGFCESLATPHVHPVPRRLLTPGRHTLRLVVDNSPRYGFSRYSHSYGPSMQAVWNGVLGKIEIRRAHSLRAARVFADASGRLEVETDASVAAVSVDGLPVAGWKQDGKRLEIRLGEKPVLWNEFHPQLYTLRLVAADGFAHAIRFGFRSVGRRGHALTLNGCDFFVRGNIENANFAKDGLPWTDVAAWRKMLGTLKDEDGVNAIRFHSWTPPRAAFEAADELGVVLMPEADIWTDRWMTYADEVGNGKPVDGFVQREMRAILDAYGNSPSFFSLAIGNELGSSNFQTIGTWLKELKACDPRRLYFGSTARAISPGDDFEVTHSIPGVGMCRERLLPRTDWDYEKTYAAAPLPVVAHEIGQWPVYPIWDELLPKFTGTMRPWNISRHFDTAKRENALRFNGEYHAASAKLSRLIYKEEVESFLRTPSCAGLELLNVQDFTGQNEALVGWRDPFYDLKRAFRTMPAFNTVWGPVAFLARMEKFAWTAGETFRADLEVRNLTDRALPAGTAYPYRLGPRTGELKLPQDVSPGELVRVGEVTLPLDAKGKAAKLELAFGRNAWSFWVFPQEGKCPWPDGVVEVARPDGLLPALRAGKTVVYTGGSAQSAKGTFKPVYWSARWFPADKIASAALGTWYDATHPAFGGFPTEDFTDWQWYGLVEDSTIHRLVDMPPDYRPFALTVSDFHYSVLSSPLFEVQVGPGRLLVCGYDLGKDEPAARRLRASLADYLAGPPAAGTPRCGEDWLAKQFPEHAAQSTESAAVYDCTTNFTGTVFRGELTGFAPVTGVVRLDFHQPSKIITSCRGIVDGHVFNVPLTTREGQRISVDVPIIREDMLDGRLKLEIHRTMGGDIALDRIRVLPKQEGTVAPVFETDALRIEFAAEEDGYGLRRIVNRAAGDETFAVAKGGAADLWALRFTGVGVAGTNETVIVDNRASCKRSATAQAEELCLTWRGIDLPGERGALDVTVRIRPEDGLSRWEIDSQVRSRKWALHTTRFPIVRHVVSDGEADVLLPWKNMGARLVRRYEASKEKSVLVYSPSCKPPVMGFFKNGAMLYMAAHDSRWRFKEMRYTRDNDFYFATEAADSGLVGKAEGNPHTGFVMACGKGDWWQAARIYRDWALRQTWCGGGRLGERKSFNRRAAETELWTISHGDANLYSNQVAAMARLWPDVGKSAKWQRLCGRGGPKLQNCVHTPDWLPCTEEEAAVARFARNHGFLVMPYTNGRLWHEVLDSWPAASPFACLTAKGDRHCEAYTGGKYAVMCPACAFWRQKVAQVTRQFCNAPAEVNAVYLDQVSCSPPYPCRDASHGHPLGGGSWWTDGIRQMMEPIHAEALARGVVLTSEQFGDFALDLFDAFLNATEHEPDDVPFYPAVYSGYAVYYGTEIHWKDSDAARFALSARTFVWGVANGWIPGYEVENPAFRSHADIYYAFARARKAARDYLVYGSLLDELRPLEKLPTCSYTWHRTEKDRGKATYTQSLPSVLGTVWQSAAKGRRAVVAVNVSSQPQAVRFRAPGVAGADVSARRLPGQDLPRFSAAEGVVSLELLPRQIVLLEFPGLQ